MLAAAHSFCLSVKCLAVIKPAFTYDDIAIVQNCHIPQCPRQSCNLAKIEGLKIHAANGEVADLPERLQASKRGTPTGCRRSEQML